MVQFYPPYSVPAFDPRACVKHERLAFMEGLCLGVTLMLELAEK